MILPKIIFKEMTLKANIDIIKWAYFEDNKSLDIHKYVVEYFPELADIEDSLSREDINKKIEDIVSIYYEKNYNQIENDVQRYNSIWKKYNDKYFKELIKYLNIPWPKDKKFIEATVGLIPIFPRNLDTFSFSISTNIQSNNLLTVSAHESLHFLWFEKWKQLYPKCPIKEYNSPYLPWKYSEMVVDPILNSKELKTILNLNVRAYDIFYRVKDGELNMMNKLREIYMSNRDIEDKIILGFEYVKSILE